MKDSKQIYGRGRDRNLRIGAAVAMLVIKGLLIAKIAQIRETKEGTGKAQS